MSAKEQKKKIAVAFNDGNVGTDEPITAIMLALILRQIMPSLGISQVNDMVSSHFAECGKLGETTFAEFLEWLFAENKEAPASEAKPAKAPSPPPVAPKAKAVAVPRPETMPAEAAERWKQFQELLKTRQYLEDGSTSHPLCYYVQLCKQAFAEAKYEDTTILLERISNSIVEDEKRIAAAFDHFDKDGSGVLERQEFRFMCAYLGWSSEESNSIDVNQDGTVSLPELQTYVGHLGGVQKFFEHRRQRVSASRKDVRDICPIVGVEVGARVRSHFYYKNGQKSKSWREAQVLSVHAEYHGGRGILLEFGFDEAQGTKDWCARQVVPPSWILSSSDETSMAAALREVGILDDSQAMWRMVFPMSELRSIQALVSCQRSALAQIRQQASASHENALPELRDKFASLGYGDYEMDAVFSWVKDLAPLVVHVHLDQMGQFLESDEFYRNQFETKTSCGALDDGNETRIGWERTLFGDAYEGSKPFDRCKYGALNVTNDFRGVTSATQYGDSYLVLKDARLRATFCATDSGGIAGSRLGVCDRYGHVLNEYNDDELNEICRVAMAALPNSDGSKPVGGLPKSAWPQVLRGESEDPAREWITVGYPTLAHRGQGRFAYEVELYGDLCCPQVGLLSEHFAVSLGKRCPTGVGDDEHGWALDGLHGETWAGGQSSCWQGARLAESNGGKQIVGVAVDLAEGKMWFGVNGQWSQEAAVLPKLPERIAVYPALTFKGRGAFVFQQLSFPPPVALGFTHWPKTHKGKFRVDCPRVGDSDTLCCYKEFQVHGELCLKKHVQRLVASVKYREAPKFERSRNVEMTKAGHLNGTYAKVGSHNNAPLYRSEGGWIFYDRAAGLWKVSESSAEDAGPKVGDTVTAERGGGPPQAGVVSKLAGSSVEICWADGSEEDKMQPKDEVTVAASAATQFKDNGTFLLQATQDAFIQDRAPPVSGWMATPESGGYLEPDAFKDAMATLGLDESSSKSLADQLLSAISSGKQVVLRRPSVDLSFDGLWDKLGREEDAASAWKKATQAAVSKYLDSKGISKDCQVIQTEHPYPATSHSWTKDLKIPGTKGMKFVFSKMCVTYDSCASFYIRSGGISKPSVGPGMRVEVEGKDGLRRFGSVVEVAEEKGGRLVRLDYMGTAVFNKYDQVEVQKCAGDDDSWVRGKVVHFRGRGLYDVQYKESGDEDTYPEDQIRLVAATTPNCPDCASEMLWADHQTGGYAYGWSCNECGEGQLQTELGWFRWCCKECCNDYCSRCWPEKRPEGEEAPPVKKDSKKNMPASDEFAFVVDNFERLKVTYNLKEELPGSEIETFTVDYDQPLAPVGLKFFKDKKGAAQREGLKEWWRVDLFNTLLGESQSLFADLQGDFGGDPPQTAEDISKNLEGNVRRLQAALSKTDWGEEESVVFEFINGMSHRLVPEAHITFTGKKVGDEIKAFEAREIGNDPVISDLDAGLAYTAGVRKGWVLSLSDTLGAENTGKRPPITMEELQSSPEAVNKLLEMQDVTLVFECLAPDPTDNAQFCGEGFEDLDVDVNEASVEFKTDGDGGGFPDRRWGVLCLVVPSDAVPQGGAGQRWVFRQIGGMTPSSLPIYSEPKEYSDAGQYLEYKEDEPDQEILISEEATSEGKTFLKLADGRGWVRLQQTYDGDEMDSLERVSPWAEVMSGAAEVMKRAEGFGNGTPVVSREGWDEERLRALCARHGWEFEWMSEDGERRRRGAERQSMVALPAVSGTSDTHCPDGFQPKTNKEKSNGTA